MIRTLIKFVKDADDMGLKEPKIPKPVTKTKGRLSDLKDHIKELVRGQVPFSAYPKKIETLKDYEYLRMYNTKEEAYLRKMFKLKQVEVDPTSLFMNTAYVNDRGFVFPENAKTLMGYPSYTYYYDEDDYRAGKTLLKPTLREAPVPAAYKKIESEKDKPATYLPTSFFGKYSKLTNSLEEAASYDETKINELKKKQPGELEKIAVDKALQRGGGLYHAGAAIGEALSLVFIDGIYRLGVGVVHFFYYGPGVISKFFSSETQLTKELFNKQDSEANEQIKICKKIIANVSMNWQQTEHEKRNTTILQILSNMYAAIDYIEQTEKSYRDRHEYDLSKIKDYLDGLIQLIHKDYYAFGESTLFKMLNDQKKVLYMVYTILQKGDPKTSKDIKDEISGKKEKPTSEIDKKIREVDQELLKPGADTATLTKELEKLKEQKQSLQGLEEDEVEDPAALDQNEKLIKEMLKKAPTIKFDTMGSEMDKAFGNPTIVLFERNNSKVKLTLDKETLLISDVKILRPDPIPAIASLFLHRTDVDANQAEKDEAAKAKQLKKEEAKKASDIKMEKLAVERREDKLRRQDKSSALEQIRMRERGETRRTRIAARAEVRVEDKYDRNRLRAIEENHRAAVEESKLQYKREMKKLSAEISEAKRKDTADSKREVSRLEADKKRSDFQYKGEMNKLKTELIAAIEKIKPGEGQKEAAAMDLGTTDIGIDSGTNSGKTNRTTNTTKKNTNAVKTNPVKTNAAKTNAAKTNAVTQKINKACINHKGKKRCYKVSQKGPEINIEILPV